jgi:hypothetical protein
MSVGAVGSLRWAESTGGRLRPRDRIRLIGQGIRSQVAELPWRVAGRAGISPRRLASLDPGVVRIPDSRACKEAERICDAMRPEMLVNHSYRTFLWASILGDHHGLRYDEEALYVSALLHDLGLSEAETGPGAPTCFTLIGARMAMAAGEKGGWGLARRELAAEAITRHMNLYVEKGSPEAFLMTAGTQLDVIGAGFFRVGPATRRTVLERYPRRDAKTRMAEIFKQQAKLHRGSRARFYYRAFGLRFLIKGAPFES